MKSKIFNILKWSILIAYLFVILGFIKSKQQKIVCKKLIVQITGNEKFIDSVYVNNLLNNNDISIVNKSLNNINFNKIENLLMQQAAVAKAQVYSEFEGTVFITIKQRKPIARVIPDDSSIASFYIDLEGKTMPLSDNFSSHVCIISGNISTEFIQSLGNDSVKNNKVQKIYKYTLNDIYEFSKYLYAHELWGPQIEQIYINSNYDIELIPRVGNHIIILGDLNDYKYKLYKLEAMYKEGFKLADWNKYSSINLKYSNQVVCKK